MMSSFNICHGHCWKIYQLAIKWIKSTKIISWWCAAASIFHWWPMRTASVSGATASFGPSAADQWLKWMSKAQSLMLRPRSSIWVTCCARVGSVAVPLPPDTVWSKESSGNYCLSSPPVTSPQRCVARCTRRVSARLCSTLAKRGDGTLPT